MALNAAGRRIRKRKLKADINVVPYIDVMLVLLIIFMVTAPLLNLGTDINLPDSRAKSLSTPKEPLLVSIDRAGNYALKAGDAGKYQSLSAGDLTARLTVIHNQNPDALVIVAGDRDADFQKIMNGLDLVNAAGITKVSLLSRPEASK